MTQDEFAAVARRHQGARAGVYKIHLGNELDVTVNGVGLGGTSDQATWDMMEHAWDDIGRLLAHVGALEEALRRAAPGR